MTESQETAALELLKIILDSQEDQSVRKTKEYILETYAECLAAVKAQKNSILSTPKVNTSNPNRGKNSWMEN